MSAVDLAHHASRVPPIAPSPQALSTTGHVQPAATAAAEPGAGSGRAQPGGWYDGDCPVHVLPAEEKARGRFGDEVER